MSRLEYNKHLINDEQIDRFMGDAQLLPLTGLQTCQENQNNMNKV